MSYTLVFPHYHLSKMREMSRVYWCNTFSTLGMSLVTIFVPIFLLKIGYSFVAVLAFLLIQQIFAALFQYPASRLFDYFHPHHLLASGTLLYAIFFILLSTQSKHHWPLWLLALAWGVYRSIYWAAFHYHFSLARAHKTGGRQVAKIEAWAIMAATLAPAIGGIAASLAGINFSYLVAILLLVVAAVPLINTAGEPPRTHPAVSWAMIKAIKRDCFANVCNGMVQTAELALWPLLVFTFISSYAGIGLLSSVIAVSTIVVTLYVGKRQEKTGESYFIKQGLGAYSLTSIGRAVAQNSFQAFGLNLLGGIGRSLYVTPFMNRYYHNSDGPQRLGYITIMETSIAIGTAAFVGILLLLTLLFDMKAVLSIGLLAVAFFSLGVRLIR